MNKSHGPFTRLLRAGRPQQGWVNTPVVRASTRLYESVADLRDTMRRRREHERVLGYAMLGTESTHALEDALVEIEGGYRAKLFPSGLAAIAMALVGLLKSGDHVLITDAVYSPVRRLATHHLSRLGIAYGYYRADASDITSQIRPETRMIYAECPGSMVFEMVDLRALAKLAHDNDCWLVVDNTWGSGWLYNPLALGADVSVLAATKYLGGHSDVMMGAIVTNERAWRPLELASIDFGQTVSGDDAFLVLRGMRTLPLRMATHERQALAVAQWLNGRPEVARVFCPALPGDPGHALWLRDCRGTNGLLAVEFVHEFDARRFQALIDALQLFGLGASWGGYESLVFPSDVLDGARTATDWSGHGLILRLHIGLEDPEDLVADLEQAFAKAQGA